MGSKASWSVERRLFSTMETNASVLIVVMVTIIFTRVLYVIWRSSKPLRNTSSKHLSTLIVLGSGGHTAEMLNLLSMLQVDWFSPRYYIAAATDNMSLQKARSFEKSAVDKERLQMVENTQFLQIYRSREVGQSYLTSIVTTLVAIAHALWLMVKIRPQVILCNGPGTCIPLCVIAFMFKVFGVRWSSVFYVESIARVKRLSLSGLLLYNLRMADQLLVARAALVTVHFVAAIPVCSSTVINFLQEYAFGGWVMGFFPAEGRRLEKDPYHEEKKRKAAKWIREKQRQQQKHTL